MDPIFVPLFVESIKVAGTVLAIWISKSDSEKINRGNKLEGNDSIQSSYIQSNLTISRQYALDKQFLQNIIDRTTNQLSDLIESTTKDIIHEMKQQHIREAVEEVQARVIVLRQMLGLQSLDPNLCVQIIITALNPLQVSIELAKLRLKEQENIWRYCYITGTSTLIAGYAYLGQDMPLLREELLKEIKIVQNQVLNDLAMRTIPAKRVFPWELVPRLLSIEGITELSTLYQDSLNQALPTTKDWLVSIEEFSQSTYNFWVSGKASAISSEVHDTYKKANREEILREITAKGRFFEVHNLPFFQGESLIGGQLGQTCRLTTYRMCLTGIDGRLYIIPLKNVKYYNFSSNSATVEINGSFERVQWRVPNGLYFFTNSWVQNIIKLALWENLPKEAQNNLDYKND